MKEGIENQEIIVYRPFLHRLYYSANIIIWLSIAVLYRLNHEQIEELGWLQGGFKLILASSVPLGIWIRLYIVVRPRIFSKIWIDGNSLWIQFKKKKSEIHFSQIKNLKPSLVPPKFMGGYQVELHSGKKLFFGSLLKNDFLILQAIRKYSPNLLEHSKFQLLISRTQTCDEYWNRVLRKLDNKLYLAYKFLVLPILSFALFFLVLKNEWIHFKGNDPHFEYIWYFWQYLAILSIQIPISIILSHFFDDLYIRKKNTMVLSEEKTNSFHNRLIYVAEFLNLIFAALAGSLWFAWRFMAAV
ncbi:MAG: hypothetical protein VX642_12355 [Bdellovibrionota bacterium]|nr:hypothetical protein [Bdellovibrionota bacterium]